MMSFIRGIGAQPRSIVPVNLALQTSIHILGVGQSLMAYLSDNYGGNGEAALLNTLEAGYFDTATFDNQGKNGSPLTKAAADTIPRSDNWWDETANVGAGGKGPTYINRIDPIVNKGAYNAIIFAQGNADGKTSTPKAVYKQALQDTFAQLKSDFFNAIIYLCPFHRRNVGGPAPLATDENIQAIREAQLETIDEIEYVKYGIDFYDEPLTDFTHLTSAGNTDFGAKIGRRLASDLSSRTNFGFGPTLENVILNGDLLSFDVVQNDGGSDWTPPTEFTNIKVAVDGIAYAVTAASKVGAGVGTFTLASTPPLGSVNTLYTHWGMAADLDNANPGIFHDNASDTNLPLKQQIISFTNNNPAASSALDNALAWYKADDASTLTASGSALAQWDDKSGNGYHLTQSNGTRQPVTGVRSINGKNAIEFNGGQSIFNAVLDLGAATPAITVFSVFFVDAADSDGGVYGYSNSSNNAGEVFALSTGDNSDTFKPTARYFNGYGASSDTQSLASAVIALHSYPESGVHSGTEIYVDGIAQSLSINTPNNTLTFQTGAPQFCLGDYRDGNNAYLNGTIAEVIVFDGVLSDSDKNEVGNYLAAEWSITWSDIS